MIIKKIQKIVMLSAILGLSVSCKKTIDYQPPSNLIIHTPPQNLYVNVGDTIDSHCFYVKASDSKNNVLKYQWYEFLGENLENAGKKIPGATSPTFIPNKSVIDTVGYFVEIDNGRVIHATSVAYLMVLDAHINVDSIYNTLDTNNVKLLSLPKHSDQRFGSAQRPNN